ESALVFALEGPFFFGAVENFERALAGTNTDARFLIIRLKWVPFIDMTGIQALEDVINSLQKRNVIVLLSGANKRVDRELRKSGILNLIGESRYFAHFEQALEHVIELDQQAH